MQMQMQMQRRQGSDVSVASTGSEGAAEVLERGRLQRAAELLGRGRFGDVYRGVLDGDNHVAVKVLKACDVEGKEARVGARQFRREVRRYGKLAGVPGVVKFYGWEGGCVFVTELMEGGDLRDVMDSKRTEGTLLNVNLVLRIAEMVANGLAEVHALDLSHGDVKPANVLLSAKPFDAPDEAHAASQIKAKLVDFGLSRNLAESASGDATVDSDDESIASGVSGSGSTPPSPGSSMLGRGDPAARGTPAYLSPEAWTGPRALSNPAMARASDVYALAIVLYELETGCIPFANQSEWGIFGAVCNHAERPPWPVDYQERVPGFRSLIERCWAQDFNNRPTAAQVGQTIKELRSSVGALTPTKRSPESSPLVAPAPPSEEPEVVDADTSTEVPFEEEAPDPPMGIIPARLSPPPSREELAHAVPFADMSLEPADDASEDEMSAESGAYHGQHDGPQSTSTARSVPSTAFFAARKRSPGNMRFVGRPVDLSRSVHDLTTDDGSSLHEAPHGDSAHAFEPAEHHSPMSSRRRRSAVRDEELDPPTPTSARSLDYPFKREVSANDCAGIIRHLRMNERNAKVAGHALKALNVLCEVSKSNCETVATTGGLEVMASILSRHGRKDSHMCQSVCHCVQRLASSRSPRVERELRTNGACQGVLDAMRWHPADLTVIHAGVIALNQLCRASPSMCSIIVGQGGSSYAQRALARSAGSFENDLPVAIAGMRAISAIAASHTAALTVDGTVRTVLKCCEQFANERVDEYVIIVLRSIVQHPAGRDSVLLTDNSLAIITQLMERSRTSKHAATTLRRACGVISELASGSKRVAGDVFMSGSVVESVLTAVSFVENIVSREDGTLLALAALECMRKMTALGMDLCGSLSMSRAFDATVNLVESRGDSGDVALWASLFVESLLSKLSGGPMLAVESIDVVFEMLVKLQHKWQHDSHVFPAVHSALVVVREVRSARASPTTPDSSFSSVPPGATVGAGTVLGTEPPSPRRLFGRRRR